MTVKASLILALLAATALAGCTRSLPARYEKAAEIARSGAMSQQVTPAGMFNLTTWQRLSRQGRPVNVYIEGDGLAWRDKYTKSMNPTPPDPVALHLAALDKADNVIYMARPCQYTGGIQGCPDMYWTDARTAPEVIQSYMQALDTIKTTSRASGFNLIGYSGGAAVAALVAAERTDVLSLRTVAGNTDYTVFTTLHRISPMDGSLNPVNIAAKIAHIPQQHFIGEKDKVVPVDIFNSWQQASGTTPCIHSTVIPGMTHEKGWDQKWPELLLMPFSCSP